MEYKGNICKMQGKLTNSTVSYQLPINQQLVDMNGLIGKEISLQHTGKINCIHCHKSIRKTYAQGYCYQCFSTLAETDINILHPEKDRSYLGISRDIEWAKKNTLTPHYVYLSLTSNIKVGVTRCTQIPTRWIDQGATDAIILAKTPNRHIAGTIEVFLKNFFADKTNWKQMISSKLPTNNSLLDEKNKAKNFLHKEFLQYFSDNDNITHLEYPIKTLSSNPSAMNLNDMPQFSKQLIGIKGQYLIFEDNSVLNIRKHGGYEIILQTRN